jgi:hypothetical protein
MQLTKSHHQLLAAEIKDLQAQIDELHAALKYVIGENPAFSSSPDEGLERVMDIVAKYEGPGWKMQR